MLLWVNKRSNFGFRPPQLLDRGDYGWQEYVEWGPCRGELELRGHYYRLGGLLALLHALEATDIHYENIIAAGDQPSLVDLETLCHPQVGSAVGSAFDRLVSSAFEDSVLRVGLLPTGFGGGGHAQFSGLGALSGQLSPDRVPLAHHIGTDEACVVTEPVPIPPGNNRAHTDGGDEDPARFAEPMVGGFADMYRFLIRHRDALLAPGGIEDRLARCRTRVVMRPTRTYALLLRDSSHPDVLRDGLDLERFTDQLWLDVADRPQLRRVIRAEKLDLLHGDVPVFTTIPASRGRLD